MRRMPTLTLLTLLTATVAGAAVCIDDDDFLDPFTADLRCQDVCQSFEDCVDPQYDVAACRRKARAVGLMASNSVSKRLKQWLRRIAWGGGRFRRDRP